MTDDIQTQTQADVSPTPAAGPVTEERIRQALMQVYDPELGINIVDLGLVYEIDLQDNGDVDIRYSLTTMGCPIGPLIEDQMRAFLAPIEGLGEVRPELVFRPAWSPEMMSEESKAALGIF
jgi:metal-sulfur cluster biosynthetic enzyme